MGDETWQGEQEWIAGNQSNREQIAETRAVDSAIQEATGRQTVTTMRANCNTRSVTTWPLDLGGKQTLRMQLQATSSAEAHCESGLLGCQKSRQPYTRRVLLCSLLWCSSVPRVNRSRSQACRFSILPPSSKQSPSLQNHHKPIEKQGDSQNASCTAIERYEAVDLFNGMQMGGQWDWNRRALRIGVAARRQTCNVVFILSGSCATARLSAKQKLAKGDDVALR